jgi:hypothetical protein
MTYTEFLKDCPFHQRLHALRTTEVGKWAADVIEASLQLRDSLDKYGSWDDGCFYYNKHAAPEMENFLDKTKY